MDMERYGDYNEVDEAPKGSRKNPVLLVIKILIAVVCIAVVGILAFRMILFNYYPGSMTGLYFNDTLTAYYKETNGDIGAKTQDIRFPYDDPEEGNFFCDHMIFIKDAGQLQVCLRYNESVFDTIAKNYGVTIDKDQKNIFTFRLARDPRDNGTESEEATQEKPEEVVAEEVGTLSVSYHEEFMMYTYYKLVFDDIVFESDDEPKIEWLRLEVLINGVEMEEPYKILIYENNEAFSQTSDYYPSDSEVPEVDN